MLYNLLFQFADRFPLFNVLRYPSFRMLMAGLVSLVIGLFLGPTYIEALRKLQHGQSNVREDTPEGHQKKTGTPSMGGGLILWAMLVGTLLFADLTNRMVWAALILTLGFGAIGFADDWLKFSKRNSKGLAGRKKLLWQTVVFVAVVLIFCVDWRTHALQLDTRLAIPFVKVKLFNPVLPWWIYLPFAFIVIVGTSNAVNLTDGLDGLAIGTTLIAAAAFTVLTYLTTHAVFSRYLDLIFLPRGAELTIFCGAMVGASMGFLWWNCYPAHIFMGDVGSLALGGALGTIAILIKQEVLFFSVGGLFVIEALSVILQVVSFQLRGKRIFRMAPLHHHFELIGWKETQVVVRFWIVAFIFALLSLTTVKLR
jgi:phospho-N-acetylmuramoyl-pentapeptide-transferase